MTSAPLEPASDPDLTPDPEEPNPPSPDQPGETGDNPDSDATK